MPPDNPFNWTFTVTDDLAELFEPPPYDHMPHIEEAVVLEWLPKKEEVK